MNELSQLIARLCPAGVEYKTLGDIGTLTRGSGLQKRDLIEEGVGAIHYGEVFTHYGTAAIETKSFVEPSKAAKLRKAKHGDLVIATTSENDEDVCKAVAWMGSDDIAVSGDAYVYSHTLDPRFMAYLFQSTQFQTQKRRYVSGTKVRRVSGADLARIRIPVPPVEIQRLAVDVLAVAERLQAQLKADLQAEIESRVRQLAHYWNQLLTPGPDWTETTLSEIAEIFDGPHATPRKTAAGPWYLSISSLSNGRFNLATSAHLGEDQYPTWTRRVTPRPGDTMFSYETRLGQAAYWDRDEPAVLGRRMGLLRPDPSKVFPRFLTLAYLGPEVQATIRSQTVRGATVDRFPIAKMGTWRLSLPPLSEQRRIAEALDKFDALANDLLSNLPAEIAARRRQYEYYRDLLLTLPEKTA